MALTILRIYIFLFIFLVFISFVRDGKKKIMFILTIFEDRQEIF